VSKISLNELDDETEVLVKSATDARAKRKSVRHCPVCLDRLKKIGKGTRFSHQCKSCNAVLAKELICQFCTTNRVWRGKAGCFCHGCGKEQK